jgi:Dynamin family
LSDQPDTIATSELDLRLGECIAQVRHALATWNRAGLVEWLDGFRLDGTDARPVIVVAGETKRGKSAFVNTLLGRPDLSPSGLDRATNAFVRFWYAETERVDIYTTDGETVSATPSELYDWATEAGNPGNERNVAWIDVGVPLPLLDGLVVADTPGVGGLRAAHAEVTLQALKSADVLVFIVDASSPLTDPELTFLVRAAERIEQLAIVMTKRDRYTAWRDIAIENAALIDRHAPQLNRASIFAVSNTLAVGHDGRTRWGFDPVDQLIRDSVLPAGTLLRKGNLARGCVSSLADIGRELALSQQIDQSATATARLGECQRQIAAAKDQGAIWRRDIEAALQRATEERSEQLHARLNDIRNRYTDSIRQGKATNAEEYADRLQSELTEVAAQLDEESNSELAAAVAPIAAALDQATSLSDFGDVRTITEETRGFAVPLPSAKRDRLADHLTTAQTASSGRYLVTNMAGSVGGLFGGHGLAAGLTVLGPASGFVTLPLAALYAALMHKGRRATAYDAELRSWTAEQVNEANFRLSNDYRKALAAARTQIIGLLDQQLAIRDQQLQRLAIDAAAAAAASVDDQKRRAEAIQAWRQWIAAESRKLETVLHETQALYRRVGSPASG